MGLLIKTRLMLSGISPPLRALPTSPTAKNNLRQVRQAKEYSEQVKLEFENHKYLRIPMMIEDH